MTIIEPTAEQYALFGKYVAALLGAQAEWSGGDCLDDIASAAKAKLGVRVGDQDDDLFEFWRDKADALGIYYDDEGDSL